MWIWIVSIGIAAFSYLLLRKKPKKTVMLRKPDYQQDMVYIVQFPVSPKIRTISPFALKLETWLRLKKIKYEPIYSLKFSQKGQIPYIELNGEQIPDSNQIIKTLEEKGLAQQDSLSPENHAISHLINRTMENHTCIAGFHWRYGYNMPEFFEKLCEPYFDKTRSMSFFKNFQPYAMILKTKMHGLGRHSLPEIANFSFQDLDAFSLLLGDKPFFNGDVPSTIDCTMFGHLVQFIYMPLDIPQKKYIQENCSNLASFVDRMRCQLWPDWDEMCQGSCMEGKKAI